MGMESLYQGIQLPCYFITKQFNAFQNDRIVWIRINQIVLSGFPFIYQFTTMVIIPTYPQFDYPKKICIYKEVMIKHKNINT